MKDYGKISILMGVFNCEETLRQAIDSILAQTYTNWEFIICDDASSDGSYAIAKEYKESFPDKFILLQNEENSGLNKTLNHCLEAATGEYIARMDADDISKAQRFEKEMEVLQARQDIAIVSTDMEFFDEDGVWGKTHTRKEPQKQQFLRGTPFCHAACLVRKEAYLAVGGYTVDKKLLRVEDYHLWIKMYAKGYKGFNIQEPLYQMRDDRNAQKRKKFKFRLNEAYVKAFAVRRLHLPIYGYLYCLKPILIGLMPSALYRFLHRGKYGG